MVQSLFKKNRSNGFQESLYSNRHNFKDALREVDVDEALSDALTGHSHKSIGRQYGKGYSISRKYETINLINYSVLDLAKIY